VAAAAPNASHWVAAYSPAGANVTETAPTKYAILSEVDASYASTGTAKVRFQLACMRHGYDFVLYTDDWVRRSKWLKPEDEMAVAVAVARSAPVKLKDADGPRKPRVVILPGTGGGGATFAKSRSSALPLAVVWSSGRSSTAMPALRWWLEPATATATATAAAPVVTVVPAKTETYGKAELCGAPATTSGYRDIGFIHTASVVGAPHGVVVRYQLIDDLGGLYPMEGEPALTLMVGLCRLNQVDP
jgi:hypothetical protein